VSEHHDLNDVLNTIDDWLAKQKGVQTLSFSYESGGFRVTLDVKSTRGMATSGTITYGVPEKGEPR